MRQIAIGLALSGLIAFVGCNKSEPGGSVRHTTPPGSSGGDHKGSTSASFKLSAPATSTHIKQGETKEVKLKVDRGKDFKSDVTLKFDAPAGVTVEPSTVTVKASDAEETAVKVSAGKDTALGDHMVKVTGTPSAGEPTSVDFKVTVEKP